MTEEREIDVMARTVVRLTAAAGAVGLTTLLIRAAGPSWHLANLTMLYLLVIQLAAVVGGRLEAVVTAVLSFMALNWFFVHPVGRWAVSDPEEWLVLVGFLITGLITGQMATGLRARAREARERAQEMQMLYELGTATGAQLELDPILNSLAKTIHERFGGAHCEFLLWDREEQLRSFEMPAAPARRPADGFPLGAGSRDFGQMNVGRGPMGGLTRTRTVACWRPSRGTPQGRSSAPVWHGRLGMPGCTGNPINSSRRCCPPSRTISARHSPVSRR